MRLELLSEDFSKFHAEFGMPLHIKDFCGYILAHPVLGEFAGSYLYHENSFCNYVKSIHDTNEKCIITSNELMMQHLRRRLAKLRRTTPPRHRGLRYGYYGVCWCGIGEYVYPICHNGVVIGALLAGAFRSDEKRLSHSFRGSSRAGASTAGICAHVTTSRPICCPRRGSNSSCGYRCSPNICRCSPNTTLNIR